MSIFALTRQLQLLHKNQQTAWGIRGMELEDFRRDLNALIVSARLQHDTAGMLFERVMAAIEAKAAADANFVAAFGHLLPPAVSTYQQDYSIPQQDDDMMARIDQIRNATGRL